MQANGSDLPSYSVPKNILILCSSHRRLGLVIYIEEIKKRLT